MWQRAVVAPSSTGLYDSRTVFKCDGRPQCFRARIFDGPPGRRGLSLLAIWQSRGDGSVLGTDDEFQPPGRRGARALGLESSQPDGDRRSCAWNSNRWDLRVQVSFSVERRAHEAFRKIIIRNAWSSSTQMYPVGRTQAPGSDRHDYAQANACAHCSGGGCSRCFSDRDCDGAPGRQANLERAVRQTRGHQVLFPHVHAGLCVRGEPATPQPFRQAYKRFADVAAKIGIAAVARSPR
ncbi:hypothetical protein GSI_01437 [Ganoderma sinense ZZ0214-1]|uniref:Uncharacterized protein n=1 Tax=Ganoderma sinense ZZ0214-1 TaxID=1077348 RepID=A0A2G8SVL4_9APHY|nr:hypothetical protein GSI_01437 [Ganoderma sinense ZZ0214-1]